MLARKLKSCANRVVAQGSAFELDHDVPVGSGVNGHEIRSASSAARNWLMRA
jgi:hypothetical protein